MRRAAEAGEVLDLSRRGDNVLRATVIRDLLATVSVAGFTGAVRKS
ncbi:hypothetical protein [Lentzea sp.]|nr:hypothetical protein [Lentzea sp.]HUQ54361.1 hypothetical protein [Lentzea sp.]